ncbi:hypothetical protein PSYAE_26670, partial [Pseudomonas amygdali pv. aesculi str. 0893_23]|uniref:hypothetical protein n=1 Tax=Pseudomonas amygdali TaxID=47877 RepID=UPI000208C9D1
WSGGGSQKPFDAPSVSHYYGSIFLIRIIQLEVKELVPMAPEAFKAEIKRRGWEPELLAIRWAMSKRRVHQIIADGDRPRYYDDAVMALPAILK